MNLSDLQLLLTQDVEKLQEAIHNGLNVNMLINEIPLITLAIQLKSDHAIRLILENGADPNKISNKGFTPLACACYSTNLKAVSELLQYGADPNQLSFGSDSESALHFAVINGLSDIESYNAQLQIVELLLSAGANINHQNNRGNTALIDAFDYLSNSDENLYLLHKKLILTLVNSGADLQVTNFDNISIFNIAKKNNFHQLMNEIQTLKMSKELRNALNNEKATISSEVSHRSRKRMDFM